MALVEIPDELFAELEALAEAECRTVGLQITFLMKRYAATNQQNRDRQKAFRERKRNASNVTGVTLETTLPPEGSSPSFPNPSNPNSYAPPPSPVPDVQARQEALSGPSLLVEAPVLTPRSAPKPRRHDYTDAFEAFWELYPGGGNKSAAFAAWKAAGLEWDEALRQVACQALKAQVAHRKAAAAAGAWQPDWKDVERWLEGACWEAKLRPIPATGGAVPRAAPVNRTVADVGAEWLRKRREAGL